jgi:hypothetical protein
MAGNPPNVPTENIDEVILRLLALEPNEVDELDYETYRQYLKELLIQIDTGRKIGGDEAELVRDEFKRVRGKKGRFKIKSKKTKVTANGLGLGGIRKQIKGAQQRIMLMPVGGIPKSGKEVKEKVETVSKKPKTETDPLIRISKRLDSIIKTLTDINKENRKKSEKERKDAENKRRRGREKDLESKNFEGIKKAISNITKPFQSIWDRIVNFITNIVLGRIVIKLLDWFADPKNQGKINSLIRFFSDHWPVLLAAYLRFGTGIGRFIGKLTGIVIKGAIKLGAVTARLLASAGLKKFAGAAKFLGGPRGRLLGAGLSAAATIGGTLALGKGIENFAGGEKETGSVPQFIGGGWNKGFNNVKNFFGNMFSGIVRGPKGRDKVPAMLTDGEFVMSVGAVRKYGVDTLEAMNSAGGGTNVPQISDGVTYAEGGGYMGDYMKDQVKMRLAKPDELAGKNYRLQNLLGIKNQEEVARLVRLSGNKVPDIQDLLGKDEYLRYLQGKIQFFAEGADEKTFKALQRIHQQHFGVGPEFEKMMSNRVDAKMLDRSTTPNPTSTPRPTPQSRFRPGDFRRLSSLQNRFNYNALRGQSSPLSPDYFLRGQSSPLRMPPPSSSFNRYRPGATIRATGPGMQNFPELQRFAGQSGTMKSPRIKGGRGGGPLAALFAALDFVGRKQEGQTDAQAALGTAGSTLGGSIGWKAGASAGATIGGAIGSMFFGVGAAPGAVVGGIIGGIAGGYGGSSLGGKIADDLSGVNSLKERMSRGGIGGAIKGGYGLKQQSFKDMPKTQIMSDDKGRPFVGYKAMRNGKPVYVRGPQPGTGTTNPFETLGRMINPGAYKDIDAANERKKYEEASKNSISSLKARGASQATISKRQAELKKGVKPLPKPKPKPYVAAGGGMGGRRGSGSRPSTNAQKPRTQNPTHSSSSTRTARSTLGINKK